MLRLALAALLFMTTVAFAAAQEVGSASPQPDAPEEAAAPVSARAQALIDVLRDDAARGALLAELERLAAGAETADAAAAPAEAAGSTAAAGPGDDAAAAPSRSVGARLAMATKATVEDLSEAALEVLNDLNATQRRLSALWGDRSGALFEALLQVAATAAAAIVVFVAARWAVAQMLPALPEGSSVARRVLNAALALVLDALAIAVAWAAGYAVAAFALGEAGAVQVNQSLFLNAFLISQLCKLPLRALLAPNDGRVRPAPMTDAGARAWFRRLSLLIDFIAYAVLFVTPLVGLTISVFTARAVLTVASAVAALWAMALVLRHRRAPGAWLSAQAATNGAGADDAGADEAVGAGEAAPEAKRKEDATLRILRWAAAIWHWPALAWLLIVFFASVTRSGAVGPLVTGTLAAIVIAIVGALAGAGLGAAARRGVTLPGDLAARAPTLEPRINALLRRALGVARFAILVVTIAAALGAAGLFDVERWVAATFGADFVDRLISAALVVAGATVLWLALASWIDLRLSAADGAATPAATARTQTLLTLLRNALTVALVVLAGMIALSELGLDIGPLIASAGVFGLAIGFGAQKLVQDVITGVFIQLENAINVGDVVTVAGTSGVAERLTIRSISLRDLHGVLHVIPFSSVDMVSNFMKGFAFHVADLGIAYREDVEDGKAAMHAAFDELKQDPAYRWDIIGDLEWFGVNELGDSAVVLRSRIRTRPGKQWGVGRAYNGLLKKHCDARGVEIPYPHLTVWFGENKDGTAPPARLVGDGAAAAQAPRAPTIEGSAGQPPAAPTT